MDTQHVRDLYPICGILHPMAIHIGSIIKDVLRTKKIDVTAFARKINFTRSNAYKIFNKPSIDTQLLIRINKILGENLFFHYLSEQEIADYKNSNIKATELLSELKDIKSMVQTINEHNTLTKAKRKGKAKRNNK
jgi:hypothetical protein